MKVTHSNSISSFGGLNIIHHELEKLNIGGQLNSSLPVLALQSRYDWKDMFYSLLSVYYSGGQCIEDVRTVLTDRFGHSPFFNICSPDTLLRRMKELASEDRFCQTRRGGITHQYNYNEVLLDANIRLLKHIGAFSKDEIVLDYDNTMTFTEKADSRMTYKRQYGYQPGVCFLNEQQVLYIENRNGNSDAKSFQLETLKRLFDRMGHHGVGRVDRFRADGASHQHEVVEFLSASVKHFYIGARNSYVERFLGQITDWKQTTDGNSETVWMADTIITPFEQHYQAGQKVPAYRLLVKRKLRADAQTDLFTHDAYEYRCVMTNDRQSSTEQALAFYYHRGSVERQFDVLKNDTGWNNLPFSLLSQNTVFLYFTAMVKNLYVTMVKKLSDRYCHISPTLRVKRLIYLLVSIPGKWVRRSGQWQLRLYGPLPLRQ